MTTVAALAVILAAKFVEGAWITVLAIPCILWLLRTIRRYYDDLDADLATSGPFVIPESDPPTVLAAIDERNRMSDHALQFAMTLSPDVIAIHLLKLRGPEAMDDGKAMKQRWQTEMVEPLKARDIGHPG